MASLVVLGFEARSILDEGRYHLAAILLTPIILLLAVGGLHDPRIMVGMRKDMPEITPAIRRASYILAGIELAIGVFLLYWVGFRPASRTPTFAGLRLSAGACGSMSELLERADR